MPPRLLAAWRRDLALALPVMGEQTFRTLMRTTDVVVTALMSPAAVVAIGLADLYSSFPLRFGLGLGAGAIALSSQETGGEATATRNEAVTQALLMGVLLGLPLAAIGILFGEQLIAILGAGQQVSRLGGTYLAFILGTAPARHVGLIGARALQGTGDTLTPMYVNVAGNAVNITGTVVLGLGLFGAPNLQVVGVAVATAAANLLTAGLTLAAIARPASGIDFVRPERPDIARQIIAISVPRVADGLSETFARFPFNALLLAFGTDVNAGYQIGRRLYQQVTAPLSRGYGVAASVLVGQAIGDHRPDEARFEGWAVASLGGLTVGLLGVGVFVSADWIVPLFVESSATVDYSIQFARTFGLAAPGYAVFISLSGALEGASETRVPFVARLTGMFVFMLGGTYLLGSVLDHGAVGAYVSVVAAYLWMALVVSWSFRYGNWADRAAELIAERRGAADSN